MKKMLGLLLSGALMVSMTGCSSDEYSENTTQYLTEQGQEMTNRYRENKQDYREVSMISTDLIEKGELIKMEAKILSVDVDEKEVSIGVAPTNAVVIGIKEGLSIEFLSPSFLMDTEIIEDETVTIYGRFNGIKTKTYGDDSYSYYSFTTHFIEKGNDEEQK